MNILQAEASLHVSASTTKNIPALREQLAVLVSTDQAKGTIGVQLSYQLVKCLTDLTPS